MPGESTPGILRYRLKGNSSTKGDTVKIELYTSAFCAPCHAAASTVDEAVRLVPELSAVTRDVAFAPEAAEARGILSTPTIVLTDDTGTELFRAAGAPTVPQLLTAIAKHSA